MTSILMYDRLYCSNEGLVLFCGYRRSAEALQSELVGINKRVRNAFRIRGSEEILKSS